MLRLRNEPRLALIVFLLFCYSQGSSQNAVAQTPRTLVVVTDRLDVEYVRRIGDKIVEVEVLLVKGCVEDGANYQLCNERVKRFREFRHLFYRENTEGLANGLWRHRLAVANPIGETHRLPSSRLNSKTELKAERAKVIHQALSEAFPIHRQQLDANLRAELLRLYSVSISPSQFALLTD